MTSPAEQIHLKMDIKRTLNFFFCLCLLAAMGKAEETTESSSSLGNIVPTEGEILQISPGEFDISSSPPLQGPTITYPTKMIWSAAETDDHRKARDAIESLAIVDARNNSGFTALQTAAERGHVEVMSVLLTANANIEAQTSTGDRPIHIAAANGRDAAVAILAVAGADLHATNKKGLTPLRIAISKGHKSTADLLRAHSFCLTKENTSSNAESNKHLVNAVIENNPLAVADMILSGADVNGGNPNAIHLAATRGHVEAMSILLRAGGNKELLAANRLTPLHSAAREGRNSAVSLLAVARADLLATNDRDLTPLLVASESKKASTVRLLRSLGGWRYNAISLPGRLAL